MEKNMIIPIRYIKNPSEKIQMLAVKDYHGNIEYIDNPTEKVAKFAQEGIDKSNDWFYGRKTK
jgi:hypothetical protein